MILRGIFRGLFRYVFQLRFNQIHEIKVKVKSREFLVAMITFVTITNLVGHLY